MGRSEVVATESGVHHLVPIVQSIFLKRFRSVPTAHVDLSNPTFLVGRNGSGKSNFVDAFSFLADAMSIPLQAVFDKRGGISAVRNRTSGSSYPPNLGLGVKLSSLAPDIASGSYAFEIRALPKYGFEVLRERCYVKYSDGRDAFFDRSREQFTTNVKGVIPSMTKSSLLLPLVGGAAPFSAVLNALSSMRVYSIEPSKLREMQDPDSGVSLRPDGSNATSVLQEIERQSPETFDRIAQILTSIVPNTTDVHPKKHGKKVSLEFTQKWGKSKKLKFEAFSMSDGTLRALGLLIAVFQRPTPSLIVFEEPESTIHPGALGAVLDLIRHASRNMQVVVTTHSPDVLDAKWIEAENLRMVTWREGATHVSQVSDSSRKALQDHLMSAGELLRSNALDDEPENGSVGTANPDMFLALQ